MKAITIHQPWAQLLILSEKAYETRSWKTAHRGKLVIHAARKFTEDMRNICTLNPFYACLAKHGLTKPNQLPLGALLGTVDLIDCVPTEELELTLAQSTEEQFGDFRPGRWAWKIANPILLASPVPYQGKLGLFDVPDDLIAAALAPVPKAG